MTPTQLEHLIYRPKHPYGVVVLNTAIRIAEGESADEIVRLTREQLAAVVDAERDALRQRVAGLEKAVLVEREGCAREAEVLAAAMRSAGAPYMATGCERAATAIRSREPIAARPDGGEGL